MTAALEERIVAAIASNSPDLLAYFERRLPSADAADALAETMMTAWRRISALPDNTEQARMWLFVIARNVLANAERGERRRWRLGNKLRLLLNPAESPPSDEGAEVRDAVARLDPELAELVRLVHWDGFSLTEAAQVLEIPSSTARGRYQRAKAVLRSVLEESQTPTACEVDVLR